MNSTTSGANIMRNPTMSGLRDAVREEILHAFEVTGHARPREIARLVCATRTADILTLGTRLAEDALTEIARRELKKSTQERGPVSQLELPGVPVALISQLPQAISIPVEDADGDTDEGVIYKPLTRVSAVPARQATHRSRAVRLDRPGPSRRAPPVPPGPAATRIAPPPPAPIRPRSASASMPWPSAPGTPANSAWCIW
jgi:hypothetical protein